MKISEICIQRPVLSWVFSLAILIVGIFGYRELQVREYPDVDIPVVTVQIIYPGAAPEVVEREVVDLIEEEINTIEGIRTLVSQSLEESAMIIVEFRLERDVDVATQDVRDAVSRVRGRLPTDIEEPVVQKFDLEAQPIMWIGLNSSWMDPVLLSDFADRVLKERLQVLPGVGRILIGGEQRFAVRVDADAAEMAGRGLTVNDIAEALRTQDVELPGGRLEGPGRELVVRTQGRFPDPESFGRLIVRQDSGATVYLEDVAQVHRGVENERSLARFMQQPSVGLGIFPQSKANIVDVAENVRRELEHLRPQLPPGVDMEIAFDSTLFIEDSLRSTLYTLVLAGALVVLVMFFFLHSVRASMIPAIVIPVAITGTFGVMYFLDFSINQISLLGLILAIGLLVDDAIVMLENIYRHMEEAHEDRLLAARRGAAEIGFAVISSSIALMSIFLPVAFITGILGEFLFEFGITVTIAIAISTFVALTLTPMLCSRLLRPSGKEFAISRWIDNGFKNTIRFYLYSLSKALRLRWLVVLAALGVFAASIYFVSQLSSEFTPPQDQSSIIVIGRAPEGASLEYTDRYLREIEAMVAAVPEVRTLFAAIGMGGGGIRPPNLAVMFISLVPQNARERDQFEIMAELRRRADDIPGMLVFLQERNPFGGGGGVVAPFQFIIQHPDIEVLAELSGQMMERLREEPGFIDIDSDLEFNRPELDVFIDRELAAELGVSVRDIAQTLQILIGGLDLSRYQQDGKEYDVRVRLRSQDRTSPADLDKIHLRTRSGELVPMANFVSFEQRVGPTQINHYNRQRAVNVNANLSGLALGDAIRIGEQIAADILPADASYELGGEARDLGEAMTGLLVAFVLAVSIIYLVLAAQFESWIHPFTIMMGLPLAMTGAFAALWLTGQTLNIFSFIGFILLIGLVTKNGILLIDYTNRQRAAGVPRTDALVEAGRVRFRPILMTAATTIMATLPIALALGAGAESRAPLGIAVIGGMLLSTFLTLLVVPVVYSLLDDLGGLFRRQPAGHGSPSRT